MKRHESSGQLDEGQLEGARVGQRAEEDETIDGIARLDLLPKHARIGEERLPQAEARLAAGGIETKEIVGVVYSPLSRAWRLNETDLDVNYMLFGVAQKATK